MAIIKDYNTEKFKRKSGQDVDYKEKIRAHKLSVFLRVAVGIALVIVSIFLINHFYQDQVYSSVNVLSESEITIVSGAKALNFDGYLLIYSKDGISCIDNKGKAVWNRSYEMQSPIVDICGSTVAIGDYNGREIYVANKSNILGTIRTNLPIRDLAVSDTGEVAAVLDDSSVIRIYVYDGNTDTDTPIIEAKATMNKSGYPINVALSPNGKLMSVCYFYVDSVNMKSTVSFYNFGDVGSNMVDNFASGYDYEGSFLPYVSFLSNNSAFAIGDDRLVFYKGDEIPENQATVLLNNEILGVYNNSEYVGIVALNATGESTYSLDVYNYNGKKVNTFLFDLEYTDICFGKDTVSIYGGTDCIIYTLKGAEKFKGDLGDDVRLLIPSSSSYRYLLITQDLLKVVELN